MKKLFFIFASILAIVCFTETFAAVKQEKKLVCFQTDMHCEKCALKIKENISFEKGVKDLKTDVKSKTVSIVFDPAKTDTLTLGNAIRKLGYSAEVIEIKDIK